MTYPLDKAIRPLNNWGLASKIHGHFLRPEVLSIYMENPEIPVGKSNGMHHSIWSISEIMGCWLKGFHFYCSIWDLQLMFIHYVCYPSSVKTS